MADSSLTIADLLDRDDSWTDVNAEQAVQHMQQEMEEYNARFPIGSKASGSPPPPWRSVEPGGIMPIGSKALPTVPPAAVHASASVPPPGVHGFVTVPPPAVHGFATVPPPGVHSCVTVPPPGVHVAVTVPPPGVHSGVTVPPPGVHSVKTEPPVDTDCGSHAHTWLKHAAPDVVPSWPCDMNDWQWASPPLESQSQSWQPLRF